MELISALASIVTVLAAVAIVLYIARYFSNPDAPAGFMTLLVAILFLGAVQLFSLSIVAEYLGRVFEEVKRRPRYIVRGILNNHKTDSGWSEHHPVQESLHVFQKTRES